jgi:hypothetical protein
LTPRLSSLWVGFVTDVDAGVARELIEGLRNPVVARDARVRELVPVELTPFDEAVARAFAERRERREAAAASGGVEPVADPVEGR